jgi:hypothetical protein
MILIILLMSTTIYFVGKPKIMAGLMDIIFSSLLGQIKLLLNINEYKWNKTRSPPARHKDSTIPKI